ncbi:hypothetical protein [Psychromonas sp. Urea-02u-13]|uniref:hypothetical protein n=1 Tax=Psychromonas sp. Urea-02u-13 TaxID=2058326 RepID=UPI000C3282B4|nr:hypothetical protein [Psychromonas sp. Urea-02u-13]PKG38121.1 hypothetical protein CXF74_15340 [Psychromonas sp. Urea-02u-13]
MLFYKQTMKNRTLLPISIFCALSSPTLLAQASPTFGGPDSVDNTIEDNKKGSQKPWREALAEKQGITFGLDYNMLGVYATDPNQLAIPAFAIDDEDTSASGVARFYGTWNIIGQTSGNTGGLNYIGKQVKMPLLPDPIFLIH